MRIWEEGKMVQRERKGGGRGGKEEHMYRVSQSVNIKHANAANQV